MGGDINTKSDQSPETNIKYYPRRGNSRRPLGRGVCSMISVTFVSIGFSDLEVLEQKIKTWEMQKASKSYRIYCFLSSIPYIFLNPQAL